MKVLIVTGDVAFRPHPKDWPLALRDALLEAELCIYCWGPYAHTIVKQRDGSVSVMDVRERIGNRFEYQFAPNLNTMMRPHDQWEPLT